MFYKQNTSEENIPFESQRPVNVSALTPDQLNAELEKGYLDITKGYARDAKSVFADMHRDYQKH